MLYGGKALVPSIDQNLNHLSFRNSSVGKIERASYCYLEALVQSK